MAEFYVEFLQDRITKSEIINAENHEKAIETIRQKYKSVSYVSVIATEDKKEIENREKERQELASRIYSLDVYGFQDTDTTPADIAESIEQDPAEVIKYLLDIIDDLQE